MTEYKLYYFNGKAKGETIRMLFALADQEFEDIRIKPFSEEWTDTYRPSKLIFALIRHPCIAPGLVLSPRTTPGSYY